MSNKINVKLSNMLLLLGCKKEISNYVLNLDNISEEEMEEIDSYLYDLTTNTKQKIVNSQSLLTSLNPIQYVIPRGY